MTGGISCSGLMQVNGWTEGGGEQITRVVTSVWLAGYLPAIEPSSSGPDIRKFDEAASANHRAGKIGTLGMLCYMLSWSFIAGHWGVVCRSFAARCLEDVQACQ